MPSKLVFGKTGAFGPKRGGGLTEAQVFVKIFQKQIWEHSENTKKSLRKNPRHGLAISFKKNKLQNYSTLQNIHLQLYQEHKEHVENEDDIGSGVVISDLSG